MRRANVQGRRTFSFNSVRYHLSSLIPMQVLDKAKNDESKQEKQSRLKSLPSTYEPDVRTSAWLKLKKDYIDDVGDSLDLVPVGAWHGNGRKAQWWSPVLLALWDPSVERLVAICKCMSGKLRSTFKDE